MLSAQNIGGYEVLDSLGEGAAGEAYRARDPESGELVAVKLLNAAAAGDMELQRRFVREATVLQSLDHPNIVAMRDCGIHEDQLYCAMELVDSGTLEDVLKEAHTLPWRDASEVAAQVCAALSRAHAGGVVHRDLKPANLFLSANGQVKVGDFGLARDNNRHRLTVQGQTVGTCRYMAPEQVRGEDELSGAVDLYAVGCLLYRMVTGRHPFNGNSVVEVFEHHLFTPPPRLDAHAPAAPPELADLVERLLAKEVKDRPSDAAEVEAALRAILRGEAPEISAPEQDDAPARNLTERLRSNGAPAAAPAYGKLLVIGCVVLAVVVIAVLLGRG